jgi:hypothetical protein
MKNLLLFILFLSVYSFGQENRTVRQNDLRDTLNANSRGFLLEADSTQFRTFSNLKYATKAQLTAIGDSNFVLTSETSSWDKDASDDVSLTANFFTGTDSIHYGADSIVVPHGVGSVPQFVSIQLTSDSFGFPIWVSGINSLTFYVRRSDIRLETIDSYIKFKWMAYK